MLQKLLKLWLIALLLLTPALVAQEEGEEEEKAEEPIREVSEIIVVTASRTEQSLHEVPSALSVVTAAQIETMPADDIGDLLRNVPGLNVTQVGARDIQVSSRSATQTLATDTLVMLDGRTIYLDFFGFVMWDYMSSTSDEIKQIEVVRGPGSAVWGANAMTGVINVITKTPRELAGTGVTLGAGDFSTLYGSLYHAAASDRVGYKISLGYYEQDAYPRPTGIIPGTEITNPPGTPYPAFSDPGTANPKVDLRVDYDVDDETTLSFSAGYSGTDGIVHTGIGPFSVEPGSNLAYVKGSWRKRAMQVNVFANLLDGDAPNLLSVGLDGLPLQMGFEAQTYDAEFTNTTVLGESHVLTYGVRARTNEFDLTIAPGGTNRDEFGIFLQDEILIGDKVRWLIGARFDDIDPIGNVVSPRTSLLYSPTRDHTFRISYNQAYRAPSLINNHLLATIVNEVGQVAPPPFPPGIPIDPNEVLLGLVEAGLAPPGVPCEFILNTCTPFFFNFFDLTAIGNPELNEEAMEAFEIGYVGTFGNTNLSIAAYRNELTDSTDFFTSGAYTDPFAPPATWPLFTLTGVPIYPLPAAGVFLPSEATYRNVGELINEGIEIAVDARWDNWSFFANYTYMQDPEVTGIPADEVNLPPNNRFNVGLAYDSGRFFVNGNVNYTDNAFWTDVLDDRFWGPTDDFTLVNLTVGARFSDEKITLSLKGTNLTDEDFQAHIFGDIIPQKISGELRFRF